MAMLESPTIRDMAPATISIPTTKRLNRFRKLCHLALPLVSKKVGVTSKKTASTKRQSPITSTVWVLNHGEVNRVISTNTMASEMAIHTTAPMTCHIPRGNIWISTALSSSPSGSLVDTGHSSATPATAIDRIDVYDANSDQRGIIINGFKDLLLIHTRFRRVRSRSSAKEVWLAKATVGLK